MKFLAKITVQLTSLRIAFSDTEDECLDNTTHSEQDTQQDVNDNDYPSRQSKSQLNLTCDDSGLLVHANYAKSIYVYNQSEKSTARKNKAFQDLIARDPNFECSINWAAGRLVNRAKLNQKFWSSKYHVRNPFGTVDFEDHGLWLRFGTVTVNLPKDHRAQSSLVVFGQHPALTKLPH